MENYKRQFIELLRFALHGDAETLVSAEQIDWERVLRLAAKHGLVNVIAAACARLSDGLQPSAEQRAAINKRLRAVVVQESEQLYAIDELCAAAEQAGVYIMPIKGAVTKGRYPETYLRSMGDIDLLYKPEQHAEMKRLTSSLGYGDFKEGLQHDSCSRGLVSMEMHRLLTRADSPHCEYYNDIWDRCSPRQGGTYVYEMSAEDEFIYNFVHLTKHFLFGGIGVRFVMDVYVYDQIPLDRQYISDELDKLSLLAFYKKISALAEGWFGTRCSTTEGLQDIERFIIDGGLFGTKQNAAAAKAGKGRVRAVLQSCFPSCANMVSMFPWLKKAPILLPIGWALRALRALKSRRKNIRAEWEYAVTDSQEIKEFYKACGL